MKLQTFTRTRSKRQRVGGFSKDVVGYMDPKLITDMGRPRVFPCKKFRPSQMTFPAILIADFVLEILSYYSNIYYMVSRKINVFKARNLSPDISVLR